jgi:MarR family transcriptional regulator, temperature-dependent positive regulator of motility
MSLEQMFHRAQQHLAEAYELDELTARQFTILEHLATQDGVSQTAIVMATGIDRSTMATMIAQMTKRGFVARKRSRTDARAYVVAITTAGRDALKTARPKIAKADRKVMSRLDDSQRVALITALDAIAS